MARLVEGYDAKLEALDKEHRERLREMREANLELSARSEALKDACDGADCGSQAGVLCLLMRCLRVRW